MPAPAWLTARPIAHRGLHDRAGGIVENTLSAAAAAIAHDFAIECDVQRAADGEAVVFHDFTLDRLTGLTGPIAAMTSADLARVAVKDTGDLVTRLSDFLAFLAGRAPLICEIKSAFDGDMRLTERVVNVARAYGGPIALKSFDPMIVAALAALAPDLPRGIVGESRYDDPEWDMLGARRHDMANLRHYSETQPDFLSWRVSDLAMAAPMLARQALGLPVIAWTVRTPQELALARAGADQIIFEGFMPD